jgi:GDP-6-deoxy-D-talose 4-dehydrogenase
MPIALVTGLGGFTGRYLAAALLQRGYRVVGIGHAGHSPVPAGAESHACDLTCLDDLARVVSSVDADVVVHLAAVAFVAHDDVEEMYRSNIVGTRNLLDALARGSHRPRTVLLASSANVYGNSTAGVIDEDMPPAPANDYAVSKLAMEHMSRLWSERLPITIVRPFNYTGVGQKESFLLPKIVSHFRRREAVLELGNLDVSRDFSDVRTVVQAYCELLNAPVAGSVLNVCSGQGTSLMEVITIMEELAGYSPEIRVNPAFVRENEVKTLVGSNLRLRQVIGEVPRVDLRETLRWMFEASD